MTAKTAIRSRATAAIAGLLAIAALHRFTPVEMLHWHNALQQLYYLPIVFSGLAFGWRGGLSAATLAGVLTVPYVLVIWNAAPDFAVDQISDIPVFCAAGVLTGILAERGRRQSADLKRTTQRLSEVYQELQDNFEHMKRAERLFALGQLSAGLAHEVRNPLASIAGAAGILQRNSRLQAKDTECLGIIDKECQRLNHLVSHFLAFARPRAPQYQRTDISSLLESVSQLAAHAVGEKQIAIRTEVAPPAGPIECDPELLKQVLLNLAINAVQATPAQGEVRISAKLRDGRMLIEVKDEGCGISPADRDRIFDPFFTTKENGTGLGLPVAHQIVEQHGGMLTATPNPVAGTTFSVLLPLRPRSAA
jgi:two-component system sensor histidine kinase HydH